MIPMSPTVSPIAKRILVAGIGVVLVAVIVIGFLAGRGERAREAEREAPVNASSRMRNVEGPLGDEAAVVLDSVAQARAGIEISVLGAGSSAATMTIQLTGELVADPTQITTVQAPLAGRLTTPGGHWPALSERLARGTIIVQVSDARPLPLPRGGTVTRVSAQPGQLVQAGQELLQLTDFSSLLARIAWNPEAPRTPPRQITLIPLGASDAAASAHPSVYASAYLVGPAADVDSVTRFPVYLYRTNSTWPGARPGAPVEAMLAQARLGASGVFVPTTAVVQWEGLAWAYVQQQSEQPAAPNGGARFVRRRVDTSHPVPGGWLVTSAGALSVHSGERVAVQGAQELLSEEFRSRASSGGDADGQ